MPKIEKFYTTLLGEIKDKKRAYKQSDWGTLTEFDAKQNICKTAMCIAGHAVNMGGKQAYDLLKEMNGSYARVAELIHVKSAPTAPVFDYNCTDNGQGMAYMEMMADFESQDLPFNEYVENILSQKED